MRFIMGKGTNKTLKAQKSRDETIQRGLKCYSHSMVAGGLEEMS